MFRKLFKLINKISRSFGFEIQHNSSKATINKYSYFDEQSVIKENLKALGLEKGGYCVDIAASDGVTMSNTYSLYKDGWTGMAVEFDPQKFASLATTYRVFSGVNLAKCMVTPNNVVALLSANQAPKEFTFLNLDIDGYDYFVLDQILEHYRPKLICTEINEKIPPPIKFSVKWDPSYVWAEDHFYGQSISQLYTLTNKYKYSLVELHYNNAFLIPSELCSKPSLTPEEAYRIGYKEKVDRKEKFPWNANMEDMLHMQPEESLVFISNFFEKYKGKFDLSL